MKSNRSQTLAIFIWQRCHYSLFLFGFLPLGQCLAAESDLVPLHIWGDQVKLMSLFCETRPWYLQLKLKKTPDFLHVKFPRSSDAQGHMPREYTEHTCSNKVKTRCICWFIQERHTAGVTQRTRQHIWSTRIGNTSGGDTRMILIRWFRILVYQGVTPAFGVFPW